MVGWDGKGVHAPLIELKQITGSGSLLRSDPASHIRADLCIQFLPGVRRAYFYVLYMYVCPFPFIRVYMYSRTSICVHIQCEEKIVYV